MLHFKTKDTNVVTLIIIITIKYTHHPLHLGHTLPHLLHHIHHMVRTYLIIIRINLSS